MDANQTTGSQDSPPASNLIQLLVDTIRSPQLGSIIALAAALSLGVGLIMSARAPDYTPVLERMDGDTASEVVAMLSNTQYEYKIDPDSGAVLVPKAQAAEIRVQLMSAGISGNSGVGLELLQQENSLGTSQFMETARYQHALETELSRTISSMRYIDAARVHLALPKQSVFLRNRASASASVMVRPIGGRSLEKGHVKSIVNLVASSIPYLEASQVTVVDQAGNLLSHMDEIGGLEQTGTQFEYTRKVETLLAERIRSLLTPLVGEGSVRTSVTADIDFTTDEQTQELFDGDPAQIRSEESKISQNQGIDGGAAGIPGALTNQPNGTEPIETQAPSQGVANNQTIRNFELDKTIRHTKQAPGNIRRLSAAIIVDDKTTLNEAGEEERIKLTPEEIEQLTALAKEAMGFDEARGDSIYIFNQSFLPLPELEAPEPPPIWEKPWFEGALKQVFAGLAVLLLIFMVVRPAMRSLTARQEALVALPSDQDEDERKALNQGAESSGSLSANNPDGLPAPAPVYGDILNVARAMANEDPERVARVVKAWVET
ncbi:MAG: flagellar M-ring protein FliF [Gammaproteobacteria bacterium]|nr:flagellar M-ring protein FliF [Gammaproteobacteria bacterium]